MNAKTEWLHVRVTPETKRMLEELAKTDGRGLSDVIRDYTQTQLVAQHEAEIEAERIIREEIGGERAVKMVREMSIRPTQYLAAWRLTHPPEPTAEERRAVEIDVAGKMGLTIEEYDDGKERGNDAET